MLADISAKRLLPALVAVFSFSTLWQAAAQDIEFGVFAGTSLTKDFRTTEFRFSDASRYISDESEWFMVGPTVEVALPGDFSFQIDASRRRTAFRELTELDVPLQLPNGLTISSFGPFVRDAFTWQFSLTGKYKFSAIRNVTPFLEFGPSFLPIENRDQTGLTAGWGLEIPVGQLRVAPTLRYTRWLNNLNPGGVPNQLQFLAAIRGRSTSRRPRAFGHPVSLGLVAGFGATRLLKDGSEPAFQFVSTSDSHTPIGGIRVEAQVKNDFFLEVEALYRPTHVRDGTVLPDGTIHYGTQSAFLTWEVPALAKYTLPISSKVRPFFELGPSFRAIAHANSEDYAHYGVGSGAGLSVRAGKSSLSPTLRYTRWGSDKRRFGREPFPATRLDQIEFVVGFSF